MDNFRESVLKEKTVSVWGAGYLGYTEILRLHSKGFKARVFDFTNTGLNKEKIRSDYPTREQLYCWSENIGVPKLDPGKVEVADICAIFESKIHILAFPLVDKHRKNLLRNILEIFLKYKHKLSSSLVILVSCSKAGFVDKNFIDLLRKSKVNCDVVSAFRSDWTIDEFLLQNRGIILASDKQSALDKAKLFYGLMGLETHSLKSIKEAELYENARNALQYIATTFVNELSFAYPEINIRRIAKILSGNIELNESHLCIGAGGYKMFSSLQNISEGSGNPNSLALVKTAQESNLSMILEYAEIIKANKCGSVTILGISVKGNLKNIELSPSVILAESLDRLGIKVFVDDPLFSSDALSRILPFAEAIDICRGEVSADALILMAGHNKYRYLNQDDLNRVISRNVRFIIDNTGFFSDFKFPRHVKYFLVGAGKKME